MLMMIIMMKVWKLLDQDLSHKAAEQIMKSLEAKRLKVMADIAKDHARSLSRVTGGKELKKEVKKNSDVSTSRYRLGSHWSFSFVRFGPIGSYPENMV